MVGGAPGCTHFMHSRSRMTIDPRISTVSGRSTSSTSGLHRPGRHRVDQARIAVRCSASRMKGELQSAKSTCEGDLRTVHKGGREERET